MHTVEILWREQKYNVMFHSQSHYDKIRGLMRDNASYEEVATTIQEALEATPTAGSMRNAIQHMWGYFKKIATADEKARYEVLFQADAFAPLLRYLQQLAHAYNVTYLIESRVLNDE